LSLADAATGCLPKKEAMLLLEETAATAVFPFFFCVEEDAEGCEWPTSASAEMTSL
jgi:hypothetical protein